MLKYKIPQIVTLTLLNPPGLSGEPKLPISVQRIFGDVLVENSNIDSISIQVDNHRLKDKIL